MKFSREQKWKGWAASGGIVYLVQAVVWGLIWGIFTLAPDNQAASHWIVKLFGGFFFGLLIGLFPAGLIFLAAYALPGGLMWAATSHDNVLWIRQPLLACFLGALFGIIAFGLSVTVGDLDQIADQWPAVIVFGSLYGSVTALICRAVAKRITQKN